MFTKTSNISWKIALPIGHRNARVENELATEVTNIDALTLTKSTRLVLPAHSKQRKWRLNTWNSPQDKNDNIIWIQIDYVIINFILYNSIKKILKLSQVPTPVSITHNLLMITINIKLKRINKPNSSDKT